MSRAPIDALRSHLYPVEQAPVVNALQAMKDPANLPLAYMLPINMAQQQWKKMDRWTWQEWSGAADSYAQAFDASGATLRQIHGTVEMPKWQEMSELGRELSDEIMRQRVFDDPSKYTPLYRNLPYPSTPYTPGLLPSFGDHFAPEPSYPLGWRQAWEYPQVFSAIDEIRAQDAVYAAYMLPKK
jgi:hypothetical protein